MNDQVLVIVHNTDGRPCGWGLAFTEAAARKEAERQYENHNCYVGESRGKTTTTLLSSEGKD